MVIIETCDRGNTGWWATFADGYVRRADATYEYNRYFGRHVESAKDLDLADLGVALARDLCRVTGPGRPGTRKCGGELYVVSRVSHDALGGRLGVVARELDGDSNRDRRMLVSLAPDCACQRECLEHLMEQLHFGVKEATSYRDLEPFEQAVRELGEELLEPFVAPCMVAEQRLRRVGLASEYDSI